MKKLKLSLVQAMPWILIIAGTIGLICSLVLTADHITILKNPNQSLNCDINPVVSCGTVINSKESELFGLPNPVYGIAAFSVLITTGVVVLAGAQLKRWYWLGMNLGALGGMFMIAYLFYHSVFVINSLCPFCMVVWVIVAATFWYVTLYNIESKYLVVPKKLRSTARFARTYHREILVSFYIVLAAVILNHFWYYYGPLLRSWL